MSFPLRCFTCGKIIGDKWETYEDEVRKGRNEDHVLDEMTIRRFCCRRMFLSHNPAIEEKRLYYTYESGNI
jgi:DNA-directed RNA polymerase subunit N